MSQAGQQTGRHSASVAVHHPVRELSEELFVGKVGRPCYGSSRDSDAGRPLPRFVARTHVVRSDHFRSKRRFPFEDFRDGSCAPTQRMLKLALIDFLGAPRSRFQGADGLDGGTCLFGQLHLAQALGQTFFLDQSADSLQCFKFIHTSYLSIGKTG